jgi:hypothetical protein
MYTYIFPSFGIEASNILQKDAKSFPKRRYISTTPHVFLSHKNETLILNPFNVERLIKTSRSEPFKN